MEIQITQKTVYGKDVLYPACQTAQLFCELMHKKTFCISDLLKIKKLGYEVTIQGYINTDFADQLNNS
jgi:hypothetical protein